MVDPERFFFGGLTLFYNKVQLFLQAQYCQCFVAGLGTFLAGRCFRAGGQMNDSYRRIGGVDVLTSIPGSTASFDFKVT